jgi:hypothetical protein
MKTFVIACLTGALCIGTTYLFVSKQMAARHSAELADKQAAWDSERAELESAAANSRQEPRIAPRPQPRDAAIETPASAQKLSAEQLLARLRGVKPGAVSQTRVMRQVIHDLDELAAMGQSALPALRRFLASNEDIDFAAGSKVARDVPAEFLVPPSLRFGLLDAVKQIGGPEAEAILAIAMNTTTRGTEIAWLSRALQEIAPDKYRDASIAAARGVLDRAIDPNATNDRDQAFKVLGMFNDTTYIATAQAQLIHADGQVDKAALKYLMQTLGPQAVPLAAQLYDDPRITNPQNKEPFARLALNYVGADPNANAFWVKAVNDFALSNDQRRNLIEDLNQDGFVDRKNLNATRDLPLIDSRIALIVELAPTTTDPVNAAALREAYKDLAKMRDRIVQQQPAK